MPQGGGATTARVESEVAASASKQMFRLIREGVSWSGLERNNCFLNTSGTGGFRDVSSASGFDFPDDGRGMVLTDWDVDGDLDVLISNRNAPQIRFLRNDVPSENNSSVGIYLRGTGQVNRDAIGARVTVYLPNQPPMIRTLRAGEGFEAQGSKWLHFGLGKAAEISRVTVRWPGGVEEEFSGISPGGRYFLTHGQSKAVVAEDRRIEWPHPLPELKLPEPISGGRSMTASRLPLANLPYKTLDGTDATLKPSQAKQPMLVNLWASWCKPCLKELKELSERQAVLEEAGLQIVALSLDGVAGQPGSPEAAKAYMNRIGDPFPTGIATPETLKKITILHDLVFEKRGSISLPTSVLIDAQGHLAGYFEGPLTVERLLEYTQAAELEDRKSQLEKSLPFAGRWLAAPLVFRLTEYGNALLKHGFPLDANELVNSDFAAWQQDPALAGFLVRLGDQLEKQGDLAAAVQHFSRVVQLKSGNATAHAALGTKYSQLGRFADAEIEYRAALAIDASLVDTRYNLGVALSKQGYNDKALAEFSRVAKEKPEHVLAHANIAAQMMKRKKLPEAIESLRLALQANPDFHAARFQRGRLLEAIGKQADAIVEYEALLAREPRHKPAAQRLQALKQAQ